MGVGSNWPLCSSRSEPPSVLRVRADCGGRLFTAKLAVVVHDSTHQLVDECLPDDAILLARQLATVFAIASMTSSASAVSTCLSLLVLFLVVPRACPCGGGGRNYFRAGETVARSTPAHTLPREGGSASLPPTPLHRCNGLRTRSLKEPRRGGTSIQPSHP